MFGGKHRRKAVGASRPYNPEVNISTVVKRDGHNLRIYSKPGQLSFIRSCRAFPMIIGSIICFSYINLKFSLLRSNLKDF